MDVRAPETRRTRGWKKSFLRALPLKVGRELRIISIILWLDDHYLPIQDLRKDHRRRWHKQPECTKIAVEVSEDQACP